MKGNNNNKWMGAGLLSAFAASLCCIGPLLAVIAGTSGAAASFSWLEPLRPYLIGITVLVLGFAWYQQLKPKTKVVDDCGCSVDTGKSSFLQSKMFLGIISVFTIAMLSLPYYSHIFYSNSNKSVVFTEKENLIEAKIKINGMTCTGCENHVNEALNTHEGVVTAQASYEDGNAIVAFDKTKVNLDELAKTIEDETGYEVENSSTLKN